MRLQDVKVGKLRDLLTLQTASQTADSFGRQTRTWSDTAIGLYAHIEPTAGSEVTLAGRERPRIDYVVTLRIDSRISQTATQRFVWRGKRLNIQSVLDLGGRNRFYECRCSEEVGNAL